jgi:8-oxo-dGTP pyrophosphatase MutT (NUDIX family)
MGLYRNVVSSSHLQLLASIQPRGASVAAVCYRLRRGRVELLLVRTRAGRWTFPKGSVSDDSSYAAAAMREAFEEAGVRGEIAPAPFVLYRHAKTAGGREILVAAFLCAVTHVGTPLESFRFPTWFDVREARQRLAEHRSGIYAADLQHVVDAAVARLVEPTKH